MVSKRAATFTSTFTMTQLDAIKFHNYVRAVKSQRVVALSFSTFLRIRHGGTTLYEKSTNVTRGCKLGVKFARTQVSILKRRNMKYKQYKQDISDKNILFLLGSLADKPHNDLKP